MPHNSRSYQDLALAARFWWRRVWSIPTYSELAVEDEPLRAELFSADQMALHGKRLAATHILSTDALPEKLLSRLTSNERVLVDLAKQLAATGDGERRLSPAAEWLLDNFYLIEEEVRTARRHLPRGYSRELPRLTLDPINGMGAGLPRVYDLALQVITHSDGQLGRGTLARFIAAYQSVQPLLLGELWAFPIMLRLSLIENLRRVAARVAAAHIDRDSAATWADSMREVAEKSPSDLILVIADMARSMPSLTNAFVAELVRRLQGQGAALALPLTWVEQRLAESQQTIEQLVQLEAQQQAANQVTVSNCIGSLRVLGATDWREFVEGFSSVEQTLRGDPSGIYEQIDFATRDSYRHVVEAIARLGKCSETEVAQQAVALAAAAAEAADGRRAHVGFYLLGTGRIALEQAVSARAPPLLALKRRARSNALLLYAGAIILITLTFTVALTVHAHKQLDWPWWGMLLLALPLSIAVSQLAVSLVNWLATLLVSPRRLPRMDYTSGIPSTARTLVVVPTMLGSATGVQALVDALEVRFLGNRDANLHFGLLTDFHDAAQEHLPSDAALVELAATQIAALNAKYPAASAGGSTFFLFHRPRRWNERERVWMGYERKRGKLADLNQLLRGQDQDSPGKRFARIVGDTRELSHVRYVITLDTDTQLPRESAAQIIATMAHPLNHPRFGTGRKQDIVVEGYGILQPRVGLSLPSINRSGYARLYGGQPGIDPYTRAVSDVYQDLFDEGSFIGKGVYDVDAFERALAGRMPENRILSHDLLEGCYARAGLLSDVQLLEESPARYSDDAARRYRWIRGDWQLTGWLRSRLHMLPGAPVNPLSLLSRAKILDNLRRSLAPSAVLLMLAAGWWLLPEPGLWTLAALAVIALVPIAAHVVEWLRSALESLKTQALTTRGASVRRQTVQALLQLMQTLACLPHEAMYSLSAIARTLWRVLLSKRRLLEWRPSADVVIKTSPGSLPDLLRNVRSLAAGPVLAATCAINLALLRPAALVVAWPVLVLWLLSPLIVWWIDRPLQRKRRALSLTQIQFLRRLARRTWGFFDAHVGPEDHHLPPDNVQEQPVARIAHRTSPTNMGFALLGALVARDFGYLTTGQLLTRLNAALTTMEGMERYRGHFYNWYDTLTLRPLRPHYVSSVDSGNLAGQLLTLRAGLLALGGEPMLARCWREGVSDTFGVLQEALSETLKDARGTLPAALAHFEHLVVHYSSAALRSAQDWRTMLADFDSGAAAILTSISALQTHAAPVKTLPDSATAPLLADDECVQWAHRLAAQCRAGVLELQSLTSSSPEDAWASGMPSLRLLAERDVNARALLQQIEDLAVRAGALAEMEQGFLYDRSRHLMTIGYNVDERRIDAGYYDLLASEMRLGVFVAIAQEQIPQESWFALGRRLTPTAGEPVLLSWSGSMFEYLMPMLVMPTYENTLLDQTCQAAVQRHIEYGARRGLPWGMSESGYNATDTALNYQYRAFGVPGLGLKRGLAEDLVIAPYASMMALMVLPDQACKNLQRLAAEGAAGRYGMYEAIDYTPARLPRGQSKAVVRSFMAHHQGMGLLALAYVLLDRPMQRYFEADARLQATLLLLQERVPHAPVLSPVIDEHAAALSPTSADQTPIRIINDPNITVPEVQLLSNGRYHVMVTQAGGGYSRWKDFAVTRWQEDATRDAWGSFCYLRGVESGELWSTAHQPTNAVGENYEAIFSLGRAEFRRLDNGIETHTEIVVSPEDDIELRRLHITNNSSAQRTIEVTSYAEIVLANPVADGLHPAFSKLFVQTEILQQPAAVLCTRRPRSPQEVLPWMFQLMAVHGVRGQRLNPAKISAISHETDRARFLGRGNSPASPQALGIAGPLSNTAGSVLDPVAASRCTITLEPEQAITVDIVYGVSETRGACVALAEKYQDRRLADRVFELAWTHAQVVLRQLNASESDAQLYGRMASAVIYMQGTLRADASILLRNRRGQSGLWGYAISGDLPIVLLQISSADNIELVRQLVQAHAWWRLKGLAVDLVIWNEERDIYRQQLQEQIMGLIVAGVEAHVIDRPGGIFVRHVEQIAHEDRILLQSVARAVFSDNRGSLAEQVKRRPRRERPVPTFAASRLAPPPPIAARATNNIEAELKLYNGIGGFSADGREYVIAPPAGKRPPAPWSNVIANPRFGSVISEAGSSYTWCENAHELRLTPWHNDPVSDGGGEAIYLRDEETGEVWSPTSLPGSINNDIDGQFITRHGFGYSVFEHSIGGIHAQLKVFVALDAAVKFSVLRLRNDSGRPRTLTATGYVEWVLGDMRAKSAPHIVTEVAPDGVALYARNPYSNDYADWIGFFDADEAQREASSFTCDRTEFIGRNGSMRDPAALHRAKLSGRAGVALDPCAAIQVPIDLLDGQSGEITFRLGMGRSADEAGKLLQRFRGRVATESALDAVQQHWQRVLGAVQVRTPDPTLDMLANGWLLYQTVACRIWARSGYYQSGGAFGFRDQLQDAMALVHCEPQMLREQLLRCASRQFAAGDVQHWWHPPQGRGVRTRISDDYLWLPLALARYVEATGDTGVLDESVPFLEGREVNPLDDSYYDLPLISVESASLYEHAVRALKRGLRFGAHGLPLMGTGDWNDGMNLVGHHGHGESIWLGFFLCEVLLRFGELARQRGDETVAQRCTVEHAQLKERLEANGWDGAWYRRAYFDDGTPLGSSANAECRIDSIAQSWGVLSGAAQPARARTAMDAVPKHLVRPENHLVQLLDPPFNQQGPNPGYIAGYVPGVRENGGQYTHGAIWAAMAFAALGRPEDAWAVFDIINPVRHALTPEDVARYKVEPYVVAADVYSVAPHIGRGGWSWYTGSAGWMYRLIVESLLGLRLETSGDGARLRLAPCLPADWPGYSMQYCYRETIYNIEVLQSGKGAAPTGVWLDDVPQADACIPLLDDGKAHRVRVTLHG
jgi:cyclic beta-1,2-glucan synthetase